ncbi:MAG: hypothetical protein IKK93_03220 [Campylobacter sp.]|nr:hypothetical protein [Campylobacter sp.]
MKTISELKNLSIKWIDRKIASFERKIKNKKVELQKMQYIMLYDNIDFKDFEELNQEIYSKIKFYTRKIRQLKLLKERKLLCQKIR